MIRRTANWIDKRSSREVPRTELKYNIQHRESRIENRELIAMFGRFDLLIFRLRRPDPPPAKDSLNPPHRWLSSYGLVRHSKLIPQQQAASMQMNRSRSRRPHLPPQFNWEIVVQHRMQLHRLKWTQQRQNCWPSRKNIEVHLKWLTPLKSQLSTTA